MDLQNKKFVSFRPASYSKYVFMDKWVQQETNVTYHVGHTNQSSTWYYNEIREKLISAVRKRISTTERPIACLLSGGLDSSLITSIVSSFMGYKGEKIRNL